MGTFILVNIFYLDRSPVVAAQMMCDKHVVKMILESAQMLSTAHRVCNGDDYADSAGLYKMAHKNHPSTIWVRSSPDHYAWLYNHMLALMQEYTFRYGKHHATERLIEPLRLAPTKLSLEEWVEFVDPPQCMPDELKGADTVLAYQTYYIVEKSGFATWKKRSIPKWWKDSSDEKTRRLLGLHGQEVARGQV